MSQQKLKLKAHLRLMIPRLAKEANQLKDPAARSRWMKLRKIALSPKTIESCCSNEGVSVDFFNKWGNRLVKSKRLTGLLSKSRRPDRSPNKVKPRVEKLVLKIRRVEPYLGPERISDLAEKIYNLTVPSSTVFAILKRAAVVGKKIAEKLTKKHMKRYRRPFPGYLQMDFKYVPYKIENRQYYQLSCVDHHSSWRLIRCYRYKDVISVLTFLNELIKECPFPIIEIQTDNDAAFTDKFSSQVGVTGGHEMDQWCDANGIVHRLIPVGVKELNGKVENTHKQDDREFFAMGYFNDYESIALNTRGYNERWNTQRATRALGKKTPNEAIVEAYVKALALMLFIKNSGNTAVYSLTAEGHAYLPIPKPEKAPQIRNKTRKPSTVDKYLNYLEWADKNKLKCLVFPNPTMSQNFSFEAHLDQNLRQKTAWLRLGRVL
jgi:transposase InsO family protein